MAFTHGKDTFISLAGNDLSAFTNSSEITRSVAEHNVTCYGADNEDYVGGLGTGEVPISGIYDNSATGPRAIIEPLLGTKVTFIRRVEGTGSGLPQDSATVLVRQYVESSPVADMVTWSATLRLSGAVDSTAQA